MKQNVKVIASLVRKAKKKLYQGKRDEALELMRKAVNIDDNNGVLVQVIRVIGRKKVRTGYDDGEREDEYEAGPDLDDDVITTPEPEQPEPEPEPEPVLEPEPLLEPESETYDEDPVVEDEERKQSMAPEERLQKLFEASDMEYESGHQQKAIAYLKKARQLAPDSPEVQERIDLLKIRIKSANLVQIALKKLETGERVKAVVLAREAFQMLPDATGLDELLSALEDETSTSPDEVLEDVPPRRPSGSGAVPAEEYIANIRQMVQDNALVKAAELAQKAFGIHPDNALLSEFVDNFRKLGLLD